MSLEALTAPKLSRRPPSRQRGNCRFRDRGRTRPGRPRTGRDLLAEQIRRAIPAPPKANLCALSAALWKGSACGAIGEAEAQQLAEEIAARRAVPVQVANLATCSRRTGSRPRSPESVERRRRWVASGWLPPALAARFTPGEAAALSVVAAQAARHGRCDLALDAIAALAGVGRTTVRNALAEARRLGFLTVEVRRLRAFRNDTNVVRIASPEWQAWLSMRRSAPGRGEGAKGCAARGTGISYDQQKAPHRAFGGETGRRRLG